MCIGWHSSSYMDPECAEDVGNHATTAARFTLDIFTVRVAGKMLTELCELQAGIASAATSATTRLHMYKINSDN